MEQTSIYVTFPFLKVCLYVYDCTNLKNPFPLPVPESKTITSMLIFIIFYIIIFYIIIFYILLYNLLPTYLLNSPAKIKASFSLIVLSKLIKNSHKFSWYLLNHTAVYWSEDRFNHDFQNCFNSLCTCTLEAELTSHFFLHCLHYNDIYVTLLNELISVDENILKLSGNKLHNLLLYGDSQFDSNKNTRLLNTAIKYIVDSGTIVDIGKSLSHPFFLPQNTTE